ncbi:MAG: insulinase family protein [Myxococcota bacterium]
MLNWHAPAAGHPDGDALDVASQILSAGRSSRLYRELVYRNEQALYAEGGYWALQEAGLFFVIAAVRPGVSVDEVEAAFFQQIDQIKSEGVTEEEVAKAKRQLEVDLVMSLTTSHALASRVGRDTVFFGRVRSIDERLASIQAVTADDVKRVMEKYLESEGSSVVQVLDSGPRAPAIEPGEGSS